MLKDMLTNYYTMAKEKIHGFVSTNLNLIKKIVSGLLVFVIFFTLFFSLGESRKHAKTVAELEMKLSLLSENYNKLRDTALSKSIGIAEYNEFKKSTLTDLGLIKLLMDQYKKAVFNLKDGTKGFARLDSSTGMFFLIMESSEKTREGHKVNFRLGNPQNCVFNGAKIDVRWGQKFDREDESTTQEKWENTLESKSFPISNILIPGEWSNFTITIPTNDVNLLEYIEIKIQAEQIIMQRSSREQE